MSNVAMSSKFIIDSMLPKYASQFFNSHLSSTCNNSNSNNNNQTSNSNTNSNSTVSQTPNNSEGSPLTGSEDTGSSPPTSKMYPFVSNHPSTHTSYPTMPGFTGLDDKSCG